MNGMSVKGFNSIIIPMNLGGTRPRAIFPFFALIFGAWHPGSAAGLFDERETRYSARYPPLPGCGLRPRFVHKVFARRNCGSCNRLPTEVQWRSKET